MLPVRILTLVEGFIMEPVFWTLCIQLRLADWRYLQLSMQVWTHLLTWTRHVSFLYKSRLSSFSGWTRRSARRKWDIRVLEFVCLLSRMLLAFFCIAANMISHSGRLRSSHKYYYQNCSIVLGIKYIRIHRLHYRIFLLMRRIRYCTSSCFLFKICPARKPGNFGCILYAIRYTYKVTNNWTSPFSCDPLWCVSFLACLWLIYLIACTSLFIPSI